MLRIQGGRLLLSGRLDCYLKADPVIIRTKRIMARRSNRNWAP